MAFNNSRMQEVVHRVKVNYNVDVSIYEKAKTLRKWGENTTLGTTQQTVMTLMVGQNEETMLSTNGITRVVSSSASDTQLLTLYEGHTIDAGSLTFSVETNDGAGTYVAAGMQGYLAKVIGT